MRLAVTLFGSVLVLGGAIRVILPDPVKKLGGRMTGGAWPTRGIGLLWAAHGVSLSVKAYL